MADRIFKISYLIGLILLILAAIFRYHQYPGSTLLYYISFSVSAVYMVIGINEVLVSKTMPSTEKLMWVVGFIFLNVLTGFLYLMKKTRRNNYYRG